MRHCPTQSRTGPCLRLPLTGCLLFLAAGAPLGPAGPAWAAPAAPPAVQPAPPPMTRAAFATLLMQLQRRSFGDEQLGLLRDALRRGHYFTCEQAGQLMRASALSDDQVKIAAALYPQIIDPENFSQLVSMLSRESDRQKLRTLVRR